MEEQKSIKKNMIMSVTLSLSNFLFPLVTFSYVARVLGPNGTGQVAFVNSILQYFSYMAILGIPVYGLRECSKVRDNREVFSHLVQELLLIGAMATILSYIGLFIAVIFVEKLRTYLSLFKIMGIFILFNSFGVEWVYQACEEYAYITKRSLVFKCLSLIMTFVLIRNQTDVLMYGFITIFSSSANYICNFINLSKFVNLKKRGNYDLKRHIKPIFVLFSASIVITIYANFDVSMLGFIGSESEVGIYNAALKIKNVLLALSTAVTAVLIPRISYYLQDKNNLKVNDLIIKSSRVSLLLAVPVSLYVFIYSADVIRFVCGEEYISAISTLRVLTICIIPLILTNLFGTQLLIPLGKEKKYTQSVFIGMWINLGLNLLLIPFCGAFGAALGTLITEIWNAFCMGVGVREYIKIIIPQILFRRYLVPLLISSVLVMVFSKVIIIYCLLIRLTVTSIVFFGTFYVMCLLLKEPLIYGVVKKSN